MHLVEATVIDVLGIRLFPRPRNTRFHRAVRKSRCPCINAESVQLGKRMPQYRAVPHAEPRDPQLLRGIDTASVSARCSAKRAYPPGVCGFRIVMARKQGVLRRIRPAFPSAGFWNSLFCRPVTISNAYAKVRQAGPQVFVNGRDHSHREALPRKGAQHARASP